MKMDMRRELGPWGGNDTAKPWDDGVFLDINQVDVHVKMEHFLEYSFDIRPKMAIQSTQKGTVKKVVTLYIE